MGAARVGRRMIPRPILHELGFMATFMGWLWMFRRYGFRVTWRYEKERRKRQRIFGPFKPEIHGEPLLRAIGASEDQIAEAKRRGLA